MTDLRPLLKTILSSLVGPPAIGVVDSLYEKKNVNEFLIAKKLKLTINQTRNILYRLADSRLVSFIRKKDAKKGGWYTYFWTLSIAKSITSYQTILLTQQATLQEQIHSQKTGRFYTCVNCTVHLTEDQALLQDYVCAECGEVLTLRDTAPVIVEFEKELAKVQGTLSKVSGHLGNVHVADEKVRQRKIQAEIRKKAKERAVKRAVKAKERAKEKGLFKSMKKKVTHIFSRSKPQKKR